MGYGEVICRTLDEVFRFIEKADIDSIREKTNEK